MAGEPILKVENIVKRYTMSTGLFGAAKHVHAVNDISFQVNRGETVGIVGESGSGKSSVARILLRLNEPTSGRALYKGDDIFRMNERELLKLRRKMQMVFQDPYGSMNPGWTSARSSRNRSASTATSCRKRNGTTVWSNYSNW